MPESKPLQPVRKTRRWKRRVILALLLLAGGAVVNVAVAWGCLLYAVTFTDPAQPTLQRAYLGADGIAWNLKRYDVGGMTVASSTKVRDANREYEDVQGDMHAIVPAWSRLHEPLQGEWEGRYVVGAGWPARSLWLRVRRDYDPDLGQYGRTVTTKQWLIDTGLPEVEWGLGNGLYVNGWLPYQPIPFGFIINTLFYALLLWLLVATPFAARRWLRRRRGLCEKCAYPIGVSPVCTECGAAVMRKREGASTNSISRAPAGRG